jgi:hypothetical protein
MKYNTQYLFLRRILAIIKDLLVIAGLVLAIAVKLQLL